MPGYYRQPNLFGYVNGKTAPSPFSQFRSLLQLQSDDRVYNLLKANIMHLVAKYLDVKRTSSEQREGLDSIEAELKEQYPDIFATEESEKRLYFAIRLAFHMHTARRFQLKKQKNQSQQRATVPRSRIMRGKQKDQRSQAGTPELASKPIQELEFGFSQHDNLAENPGMSQSVSSSSTFSQSNEPLKDTTPEVTPSPSSSTKHPIQYRAIYEFLEASMPPMTHLMDSFIDFGCTNTDFLRAISSWSFEMIRDVLDRLPPGHDGRKLTEMEKLVLQTHFKDHFT